MIAQLIKELGLELSICYAHSPDIVKELAGKRHGVFYVENALEAPTFRHSRSSSSPLRDQSVLGFGGMLPNGELFAVILFATVHVLPSRPTGSEPGTGC